VLLQPRSNSSPNRFGRESSEVQHSKWEFEVSDCLCTNLDTHTHIHTQTHTQTHTHTHTHIHTHIDCTVNGEEGFVGFWSRETTIFYGTTDPSQADSESIRARQCAHNPPCRTCTYPGANLAPHLCASHTLMLAFAICTKIVRC
jgi:hypothetical protein